MTHWPSSVGASRTKRLWLACAFDAAGAKPAGSIGARAPACLAIASRTSARSSCSETSIEFHVVDDADDGRVDRRGLFSKRLARRASFEHHQHSFVHAGAHAV